ncbi:TPA: hypothetical protein JBF89_13215 [Legionella pneumophila]|nr:hypothetical protein [Legionella pneumophila]HAU0349924.1 hypothetical protein [Legionella pneumophila]HAU0353415.1 hypothetical protein [Legionella pneumophila]HAU0359504.1 hypothetical protein [Legionella pneumophila]HAU0368061.1 hypothetical protein [Legionella pneumophila]
MMKTRILLLALALGSQFATATPMFSADEKSCSAVKGTNIYADNELIGQGGVDFYKTILSKSQLYTFLLSLESNTPQITKQLEFVALINEVHLANQTLSALLGAVEKNNALLERQARKGGAMDG